MLEGLLELDRVPRRHALEAARAPRCEIQGYAYDAKMRCARLARARLERPRACRSAGARGRGAQAPLQPRLLDAPTRECFALALDGDGAQVDSITSNIGHLLWSGIVDDDKAPTVVKHLMGDELFSGWGIRTMAEGEGALQPDRLPRRHGLAARQLAHRAGA